MPSFVSFDEKLNRSLPPFILFSAQSLAGQRAVNSKLGPMCATPAEYTYRTLLVLYCLNATTALQATKLEGGLRMKSASRRGGPHSLFILSL